MTIPTGWKATNGSNASGGHTGRWSWQLAANGGLEQQIPALPAGMYKLSVWVTTSGTGAQLYAKGCGGTDATMPIPSATSFTTVTLSGVAASGGPCTVGVTSAGGQVTMDDFVLSNG